jgi:cell division protein ZapA
MASVNVTINGRNYRMACEDGEEPHLMELARDLDERIAQLRSSFGEIGDMRLTVMAALMISDELTEAAKQMRTLDGELARVRDMGEVAGDRVEATENAVSAALNSAADRIEQLAKALNQTRGPTGAVPIG